MTRAAGRAAALTLAFLVGGAASALEPGRELHQYAIRSWGPKEGLPTVSVWSIAQTPDGLIWIGTMEGLARFDGFSFEHFHRANTPAFAQNEVRDLLVDRNGALWIASVSGLIRYFDGEFASAGLRGTTVMKIEQDEEGNLFALTQEGVHRVEFGKNPELLLAAPQRNLGSLAIGAKGVVYAGYRGGAVVRRLRDGSIETLRPPIAAESARIAYIARFGDRIILQSGNGAEEWVESAGWRRVRRPDGTAVPPGFGISLLDRRGRLWATSEAGGSVERWSEEGASRLDADAGLRGGQVLEVFEDRDGNIWIGSWDGGVTRLSDAPFRTYTRRDGLPADGARAVLATRDGAIWAGTKEGLARMPKGATRFEPVHGLEHEKIWSLAESLDGAVALSTDVGRRLAKDGHAVGGLLDPRRFAVQVAYWIDRRGRHWIQSNEALAIVDRGSIVEEIVPDDGYHLFYSFLEEADGSVLLGRIGGFYRYREGAKLERIETTIDPAYEVIFALHRDSRGDLWVGSLDGGLSLQRGDRWRHLGRKEGLPDDNVLALLEDARGHVWGSSTQGIWRLDPDDVDAFFEGDSERVHPRVFGVADGLATSEGHGGTRPAAARDLEGRLWFTTVAGLSVVDPGGIQDLSAPPARMTRVEVDGEIASAKPNAAELVLPPGVGRLALEFGALHYAAPERLRFRYRLRGLDQDWVLARDRRRAEYPSLPPGRYRFEAEASLDEVSWGRATALDVEARAFFWQKLWFRIALGTLFLAAILGLVALRARRKLARERETGRELHSLVDFSRKVAGLLDSETVLERLDRAIVARWGDVDRGIVAQREGRLPILRWRGETAGDEKAAELARWLGRTRGESELAGTDHHPVVAHFIAGETPFGGIVLPSIPPQRSSADRDRAHLQGLAAQAAMALEGAWQAEEAVRWRELSEARGEWLRSDLVSRLLFAAVARQAHAGEAEEARVITSTAALLGGSSGTLARVENAVERLVSSRVLARTPQRGLRVERSSWLLLPESALPLEEIARQGMQVVGAYRLGERLGAGGMGEVFLAVNVRDGSPAAVKLLFADQAADRLARKRLEREGEIVAGMVHPNIVRLLERGEHEGRLYIAMELLTGETLGDRIERGALPAAETIAMARQLAAALAELHSRGVVHRDVKSGNVMIEPDGRVVLLDLGLARSLGGATLTQTATIIGTLPYLSPEQLRDEEADARSDLWSFGIVIAEALLGRLPWGDGISTVQMALSVARLTEAPELPPMPHAPPALVALLRELLEPKRSKRIGDASAVASRLAALQASRG